MNANQARSLLLLGACSLAAFLARTGESAQPIAALKEGVYVKSLPKTVTFGRASAPLGSLPTFSSNLDKRLAKSMKSRRDFAWTVIAKVFTPVDVSSSSTTGSLPTWHTWYEEDDFRDVYATLLKGNGSLRTPMLNTSISDVDVAGALKLNSAKNLVRSISSKNLGKVLKQFNRAKGLGTNTNPEPGTGMVLYSPGMIEHMLKNAARIASCDTANYPPDKKPSELDSSVRPHDTKNTWGMCLMHEFPKDGIMIKTRWGKLSLGIKTYGTSATDMETMWNASSTGQFASSGTTTPNASSMYTLTDETGAVWGLEGMHISTKDIQRWTWISLWFSPDKDSDFGADRPASVAATWPALANYKMCASTDFLEADSDPGRHYRSNTKTKSLAAALDKVKSLANGSQWCANPFLETSFSHTNCIGCHQGAGVTFDVTATTQNRQNGIPDFVYGFDSIKSAIEDENAKK